MAERSEIGEIRRRLRLTQDAFADALGVPRARYTNWEYGRADTPSRYLAMAKQMEKAGVPDAGRMFSLVSESEVLIPYIGTVAASSPISWASPYESPDEVPVPVHMMDRHRGAFAAHVGSDSMYPMLIPGDLCIFKPVDFPRIGQVVMHIDKDVRAAIKQLKHDGERFILHSLNPNPDYQDVPASGSIAGVLIGVVRTDDGEKVTMYNPDGLKPK